MPQTRNFAKNQVIFQEGQIGNEVYFIHSGSVQLFKKTAKGPIALQKLGPSEVFGEMAVIDKGKRSADAIALDNTSLTVISLSEFDSLIGKAPPWFKAIIVQTASRIRDANSKLKVGKEVMNHTNVAFALHLLIKNRNSGSRIEKSFFIDESTEILGIRRRAVGASLLILQKQRLLSISNNIINVPSMDLLYGYVEHSKFMKLLGRQMTRELRTILLDLPEVISAAKIKEKDAFYMETIPFKTSLRKITAIELNLLDSNMDLLLRQGLIKKLDDTQSKEVLTRYDHSTATTKLLYKVYAHRIFCLGKYVSQI